jgi:adenylate kinase family enzyme
VICLEISDSKIYERLEHRRFDPLTGTYYNTATHPPTDEAIISRLIQSPEDAHHIVKKRLDRFKIFLDELEKTNRVTRINADTSLDAVFASISEVVE